MKKIIFREIEFSNFKGTKYLKTNFNIANNKIKGKNGSGKTTLAETLSFILFGKGLFNEAIKNEPIGVDGQVVKNYNQKLTLKMEINGINYNVSKTIRDNSVVEMSINDEIFDKKKDFTNKIIDLIGVNDYEYYILTNPKYFNTLTNKDARTYIISYINEFSDMEIVSELLGKENTLDANFLNVVIDNLNKGFTIERLLDYNDLNVKNINNKLKETIVKIDSKLETLNRINADETQAKNIEELIKIRDEYKDKVDEINEQNKEFYIQNAKHNALISEIDKIKNEIVAKENEIGAINFSVLENENVLKKLRVEYDELNAKPINDKCAICGNISLVAKENATKNKEFQLKNISAKGISTKHNNQRLLDKSDLYKKLIIDLKNKLDIKNMELSKINFVNDIQTPIEYNNKIMELNQLISGYDIVNEINKEIQELENDKKELTKKLDVENDKMLNLKFIQSAKYKKIENDVNKELKNINIKLFEILKNGNVKEIFTIESNGIDFARMNNALQIQSGIELISFIQKQKGINLPIIIDNAESMNVVPIVDSQTIELYVTNDEMEINNEQLLN